MYIKICGVKSTETIQCCESNKVNFFGMIFYPPSPRNITKEQAKKLQNFSKNLKIKGVGVFVNENISNLISLTNNIKLNFVQLHGNEDNEYVKEIKKLNVKIIKKISVKNENDIKQIEKFENVDYFLFDYKPETNELPGGNAKTFDWKILQNLTTNKPWFLSGGINMKNIELIKTEIKPFGIDLSSGVEKELGIKDNQIINNFIGKLKNA